MSGFINNPGRLILQNIHEFLERHICFCKNTCADKCNSTFSELNCQTYAQTYDCFDFAKVTTKHSRISGKTRLLLLSVSKNTCAHKCNSTFSELNCQTYALTYDCFDFVKVIGSTHILIRRNLLK